VPEFIAAILFVLSSGLLFQKRFRENAFLLVVAGVIGLVSSYFLIETIGEDIQHWLNHTEPPVSPPQTSAKLNARVAAAIAKAEAFETEAHARAADAAIVVDQATDAAARARAAAAHAQPGLEGYSFDETSTSETGLKSHYNGEAAADAVGVMTWDDGDRYEGEWKANMMTGTGIYYYHSGQIYTGQFQQGVQAGIGQRSVKDKTHYEGQFAADTMNGVGVVTFPDGEVHAGQFSDGFFEGYGIATLADGSRFLGEWHRTKLNGYGAKFDGRGTLIEQGVYENDKLQKRLGPDD
jgi:hypothetical protein